jgi:hypothetical protein
MPVQIQGDVTAVYEPVITIADTGEVLTEAQLYDTTLALANRIEFVRSLTPEATEEPEAFGTFREEFWGAIFNSGQSRLDADNLWRSSVLGFPSVNQSAGTAKNPGQLVVSLPPTGSGGETDHGVDFYLGQTTGDCFSFATIDSATVVVKIDEDPANINATIQFGFAATAGMAAQSGGADSLQICRNVALGADDWFILKRKSSVQTLTILGGTTFTNGEFHVWRIRKQTNGDLGIFLDGALVHTVAFADLPTGSCTFRMWQLNGVADTEITTVSWDLIAIRSTPGDRSGA